MYAPSVRQKQAAARLAGHLFNSPPASADDSRGRMRTEKAGKMATIEDVTDLELRQALEPAVSDRAPAIVSVRVDERWLNLHSRFIDLRGQHLLIQPPVAIGDVAPHEFHVGEPLHVALRHGFLRCTFITTVTGLGQIPLDGRARVPVLSILTPASLRQVQQRSAERTRVPEGQLPPALFWLGDRQSGPEAGNEDRPSWPGRVVDFSIGGLRILVDCNAAEGLAFGDRVGVRLCFGIEERTLYADALFRHLRQYDGDEAKVLMGLQLLDLDETPEGRQTLTYLMEKVQEFRHALGLRC
jgi:hypothetical protein